LQLQNTRAEGGFVTGVGNLNMGLYMNRVTTLDTFTHATAFKHASHRFYYRCDMGVKWGLGLSGQAQE